MARPRHKALALNSDERNQLNSLVRAHSTPQQLVLRARMILGLAEEGGLCAVAHDLGVWRKTVRHWRNRWLSAGANESVVDRLTDAPRSGTKPTFTPEQICAIIALACEPPEESGLPITHWSQSELAREAIKRDIVDAISHRSVGRFLKGGGSQTPSSPGMAQRQARS